jgi:glycosyltransferase involved in cell wall biosynthesis
MLGLVSVIIPSHEGRDLSKVLEYISKSTYRNVEVIIVKENKERSIQRNIGIVRANGKYLLFLDSDMLIAPNLIEDCLEKIKHCRGVYLPEVIITKGFFAKVRNWERQFYTGTPIDCVRFVRYSICPLFDESLIGPEDSDWDRRIPQPKLVSDSYYLHDEDVNVFSYFKKKAYYSKSMKRYKEKHPNDKVLDFRYRCFGVFVENGKWKRLFHPFALIVLIIILIRGVIYLWNAR